MEVLGLTGVVEVLGLHSRSSGGVRVDRRSSGGVRVDRRSSGGVRVAHAPGEYTSDTDL